MNFYKRFLGDIQKKTGSLSLAEMGAYDRLLDHYYSTEEGLPADHEECYRIARAMNKDERKAVDKILNQYFVLIDGRYLNDRAEEEIVAAQPALEAARMNGAKGGRPKKETEEKPSGLAEQNPAETQDKPKSKALQSQNQNNKQKTKTTAAQVLLAELGITGQVAEDWIKLRLARRAEITKTALAGIRREAEKAHYTLEEALQTCCERGWTGFKADWVEAKRATAPAGGKFDPVAHVNKERTEGGGYDNGNRTIDIEP